MTLKVVVSAGHGPQTAGKRSPDGYKEFQFNQPTADLVAQYLLEYQDVSVLKVYEADRDVPLRERTAKANSWGGNLYMSIHYNAIGDKWNDTAKGIETLVYRTAIPIAKQIHEHLIRETGRSNRGIKIRSDLWEMRATKMEAVLAECGFMSNPEEAALMKSQAYREKCARGIVNGIADHYKLKKKVTAPAPTPTPTPNKKNTLYKVQIGAFSNLDNAKNLVNQAKAKGFSAYIAD